MKITLYLFLLFTNILFAQSGIVVYSIQLDTTDHNKTSSKLTKQWADINMKMKEYAMLQQFELIFDKNQSSFKYIERLNSDINFDDKINKISKSAYTSNDDVYVNVNSNTEISQKRDGTIVQDNVTKNWEILNESKKIGGYLCYKAILKSPYVNRFGESKIKITEAWFTPSIPYSYGPKNFYGLPGLILELRENRTTYLATKIEFFDKDLEINFPKGKTVTKEEYDRRLESSVGGVILGKKREKEKQK